VIKSKSAYTIVSLKDRIRPTLETSCATSSCQCCYAAVLWAALASCPSVCPMSICPSVRLSRNSKTKKSRKVKIGVDFPHGTSKWSANFQFERSKVRVIGRKTSKIWRHLYLWAAVPADQALQAPTANLAYAIVRPTLLSAPKTLDNGTDGLILDVGADISC